MWDTGFVLFWAGPTTARGERTSDSWHSRCSTFRIKRVINDRGPYPNKIGRGMSMFFRFLFFSLTEDMGLFVGLRFPFLSKPVIGVGNRDAKTQVPQNKRGERLP